MTPLVAEGRNGTPPFSYWSRSGNTGNTGGVGEVRGAEGVCLGCKGRRLRVRMYIDMYIWICDMSLNFV